MKVKNKIKNKKAQEEMLGFAFVIVLIVAIGLAFLLLSLRKASPVEQENFKVNNLLNAIGYLTTSCEKKNVQELIIACNRREPICGKEGACNFVEKELKSILDSSLRGDYSFTATLKGFAEDAGAVNANEKFERKLIELQKGDCPGKRVALAATSILPAAEGSITVKLVSCPVPA